MLDEPSGGCLRRQFTEPVCLEPKTLGRNWLTAHGSREQCESQTSNAPSSYPSGNVR